MKKICIGLFDYTGNFFIEWQRAGYEIHLFDIQHPEKSCKRDDGIYLHNCDLSTPDQIFDFLGAMDYGKSELGQNYEIAFIACWPPCTHVAVSGARWFRGKGLRKLQESIGYFATCAEILDTVKCAGFIENPMSTVSTYWRAADFEFNPCDYSGYVDGQEDYTKSTWLWVTTEFVMPPKNRAGDLFDEPDKTYIHHQPPGEERANIRSATPKGFSRAVFLHNCKEELAIKKAIDILGGMAIGKGD